MYIGEEKNYSNMLQTYSLFKRLATSLINYLIFDVIKPNDVRKILSVERSSKYFLIDSLSVGMLEWKWISIFLVE